MKRFFPHIFAILSLLILTSVPSHAENLQLVMPKIIYIGDTVEIRYIFHSEAKLFGGAFAESPSAFLNLNTDYDFFKANAADFTVKTATLEKINAEYTLTMTVIPWKTGFLQIPPFNLNSLVNSSLDFSKEISGSSSPMAITFTTFIINLSPIEVKSIVAKTGHKTFLPQSAPLVMSGTTAFLAILAIISLTVFSVLVFILLHIPRVAAFVKNISYLYSLRKNSRRNIRRLVRLQKNSKQIASDKDFAEKIQHILREFLNKRFGHDFSSITTSRLYAEFTELSGGTLGTSQEDTIENLLAIFNRLEYIRFAEAGKFLSENENNGKNERFTLAQNAIHLIEDFDKETEE